MEERLYLVTIEAQPGELTPEVAEYGGAFFSVFTVAESESDARSVAVREVQEAGWRVLAVDSVVRKVLSDFADDPAGLELFEQALVDGIVMEANAWPVA